MIYCVGTSISGITVNAKGGAGGSQVRISNSSAEAEGPGGGGSGGYISVTTPNRITTHVDGGANGTTNSPSMTTFTPNGATNDATGIVSTSPSNPYSGSV